MPSSSLKQHSSRIYRALALFYFLFPVTFLPLVVFLFDISLSQVLSVFFSSAFLGISFLAVITGYGLYQVRSWSWYLLQITQIMVILLAAYLSRRFGQSNYPYIALGTLAVLLWMSYRWISRELRVPYIMPQIAWWESDPKFRTRIPAEVSRSGGKVLEADIMDLSLAGCFVKCKPEFQENEIIEIRCRLFEREWKGKGVVLWNTFGAVTHPRGIGIKFSSMDRSSKRVLKAATLKLSRISKLNRTGRYLLSVEEYNRLLAKLGAPLPRGEG